MIKIICVGKIKEKYLDMGIDEYLKRIKLFHNISIVEVKEGNNVDIKKTIEYEGLEILNKIEKNDYVITLEIEGKMFTSIELANKIDAIFTYGNPNLVFIIGGSWGLNEQVKTRSNLALSFSKFTFPHQLMRLILVEQIYRAFTILNHKEYHK